MDTIHNYVDADYLDDTHEGEGMQGNGPRYESGAGTSRSALNFAHMLFVGALFLLPFIFIPVAGWGLSVGKVIVAAILVMAAGAAVFASTRNNALTLPQTPSMLLLGLFAILVLSTVFSDSLSASLFGSGLEVGTFFTTAIAIAIAFIAPLVLTNRKRLVVALAALFAGGAVLALFHVIRLVFGPGALSFGYFTQPTLTPAGSWNDLGIFFGVTYLVSLTGVMFGKFPGMLRAILGAVLLVSLAFVVLVNFQLLSIALSIATLALLLVSFTSRSDSAVFPAVGSLVFLALISIFTVQVGNMTGNLFNTTYAEIRPNWSSTGTMLSSGLADVKNAVLGKGPNTFAYLWQQERSQDVINSQFWSIDFSFATGIIPTFAVTLGLLAVALMLGFALYLLLRVFSVREDTEDPLLSVVALASGVAAVFLWVFAIFYVFNVMIFLLMFALSGIAIAALTQGGYVKTIMISSQTRSGSLFGALGAGVCLVLLVPALLLSVSRTMYGQGLVRVNTAEGIEDVAIAQEKVRRASIIERSDDFARTETELGLARVREFLSRENPDESAIPAFRQVVRATQAAAERARTINPEDYLNWVNAGLVYETLGILEVENAFDLAAESYAEAQKLNPTNPELLLIQARLARVRENDDKAIQFAEQALQLKPNYANAHLLLANMALAEGDALGAIGYIEAAIEASPGNAFLNYQLGLVHYSEGDYEDAIAAFTDSVILDPNYANARYFRALAYVYGSDNREEALQDLEVVRESNPENETLLAVIENIEAGNDPLLGIAEESAALPPEDDDTPPETNAEAIDELEEESDPQSETRTQNETEENTPPETPENTPEEGTADTQTEEGETDSAQTNAEQSESGTINE